MLSPLDFLPENLLSQSVQKLSNVKTLDNYNKLELESAIYNLSLGEPSIPTPDYILEATKKAINSKQYFGYPPISGYEDLKQAIVDKYHREYDLFYDIENIVVSSGAKQAISNVLFCLINPQDEVLVYKPFWPTYVNLIKFMGGIPKYIPEDLNHSPALLEVHLQQVISPKTKAIIYSSPSNPTGSIFPESALACIQKIALQHKHMMVISDEIYEYITFNKKNSSIATLKGMKERTIIINGFSKAFSMAGWRIGYLIAPKWLAKACHRLQGQLTSGPSSIAQRAAFAALTHSERFNFLEKIRKDYESKKNLVINTFKKTPGVSFKKPEGAFYLFLNVSSYFQTLYDEIKITNSTTFCKALKKFANVIVVEGGKFGKQGFIRLSYTVKEYTLQKSLDKIQQFLIHLNKKYDT